MIGLVARPYDAVAVNDVNNANRLAAFPASNVLNNDYGRVAAYQKPGANDGVLLVLDLGAPKPVDVLAMLWHNLMAGALIGVRGTNNPDGASDLLYYAGGLPSQTGMTYRDQLKLKKFLLTLPGPVTARYWSFEFPIFGGYYFNQVSRVFAGKGAQFIIGPQKASLGAKDMNANVTTEVGEQRSQEDPGLIRPVVSLSFEYAKLSEMEQVLGQYTLGLGVSKPLLICTDLTSAFTQDNIAFGRPEKVVQLDSSMYDVWSFEAVVPSLGV